MGTVSMPSGKKDDKDKLDMFAAAALSGLLSSNHIGNKHDGTPEGLAKKSYVYAKAMMAHQTEIAAAEDDDIDC